MQEERVVDFEVSGKENGKRLDSTLKKSFEERFGESVSRESVKGSIEAGLCLVNEKPATSPATKLRLGDKVRFCMEAPKSSLAPENGEVEILYSDEDIVVCNKQPDVTVHPCPSCPSNTLIQRLASRFPSILSMEGLRPGIVHRIDKDTSGIIVVALNESARLKLAQAFEQREVHKEYLALVEGCPDKEGRVDLPIGRDLEKRVRMAIVPQEKGGREAHSVYETLLAAPGKDAALVKVRILTGRTHQVRLHMASIGHALLGDGVYARKETAERAPRQMLHAWRIEFRHPTTGKSLLFTCPPPQDFRDCALAPFRKTQRVVVTGNPGSGKSALLELFKKRGVPVLSADALVAGYYAKGGELSHALCMRFGQDVLGTDGAVDKRALFEIFQKHPHARQDVQSLVHALVLGEVRELFSGSQKRRLARCCAEIPLYFEGGWDKDGTFEQGRPVTVGVSSGEARRKERLQANRSWSEEKISAIEHWQWPEAKKIAACDLSIENAGTLEDLESAFEDGLLPKLDALLQAEEEKTLKKLESLWA